LVTLVVGISLNFDPLVIFLIYGMSYLAAGSFAQFLLVKNLKIDLRSKFHGGLLQKLGSFTIGGLLFVILPHLGPIILEKTITLKEVGQFAVAYRIPQALQQIPFIVAGAYYPVLFKAFNNNLPCQHLKHLKFQIKLMALVGMLMTVPFYHLSDFVIKLLFGEEWMAASYPLKILSFLLLLQAIGIALADGLTTSGKQFKRMLVQALAVIGGIVFYVALSTSYGIKGAAYAGTLVPYLSFFFLSLACTDFLLSKHPFLSVTVNLLLVLSLIAIDKELKNKISDFIQAKKKKSWELEKNQEVHHGL
jgi:O-antigen/teichoic acid export membrane protein